jgi:hypothetical protein
MILLSTPLFSHWSIGTFKRKNEDIWWYWRALYVLCCGPETYIGACRPYHWILYQHKIPNFLIHIVIFTKTNFWGSNLDFLQIWNAPNNRIFPHLRSELISGGCLGEVILVAESLNRYGCISCMNKIKASNTKGCIQLLQLHSSQSCTNF